MATAKKTPAKKKKATPIVRHRKFVYVVPDRIDLRDRMYQAPVHWVPKQELAPDPKIPVLDQGQTNACTGFALASVIYKLQSAAKRETKPQRVSGFMLYDMARRYDEFPGAADVDTGSSLRGAMKGWYKHGACAEHLWTSGLEMPPPAKSAAADWWLDAVKRPLGAYYRIDTRSVTDMQVALNEIGILYASAVCHENWDDGYNVKSTRGFWQIPPKKAAPEDTGHAFAIVGYTREGFIIHNSWTTAWGTGGRAVLTYEDWLDNAMDCWVAQLGVPTELHEAIAKSPTLRVKDGKVQVAGDPVLRNREISPFVIDMENNGLLSNTGDFRTQVSDVEALVTQHLAAARAEWQLGVNDVVDVAIYAHGGLTSENDAAGTAVKWIKALYGSRIFPIFLMWETDLWSTLKDLKEDERTGEPRTTGGIGKWWNERLEKMLATPGSAVWGEMKKNADAISVRRAGGEQSGGIVLYDASLKAPLFADMTKVRLHLIGHSAGAIVHSYIVDRLGKAGWNFETVNFMAPAVRVDTFVETVAPALQSGKVKRFNQFHLTDDAEQKDHTCRPVLLYGRSLLYLVSQSFEQGKVTPILGMQKYFEQEIAPLGLPNVNVMTAPGPDSGATEHGAFDDDTTTINKVISLIAGR